MSAQVGQLKIYVGDLPVSVDRNFLTEFFSEAGKVKDVTIKVAEKGLYKSCSAIIEFESAEAVRKAIDELNYTKFDNVPIRISHYNPTPSSQRSGNLFIKNLDPAIEVGQLHEAFSNFGEIISCKIAMDVNGQSKGFGYVQFKNKEDAEQAMRDLKDASINGKTITIEPYVQKIKASDDSFTNIYINSLPDSIDSDEKLRELFAEFGPISSVKLEMQDGKSKGFGYCSMGDHESAVKAVKGLDGKEVEGKVLHACRMKSKAERESEIRRRSEGWRKEQDNIYKDRNLYIKGFDEDVDEEEIKAEFSRFGEIESIKIPMQSPGWSYGYGYVCYKTAQEAENAIKESTMLKIRGRDIYVSKHISAKEREEQEKKRAQEERKQAEMQRPQSDVGVTQNMSPHKYYQQLLVNEISGRKDLGPKSPLIAKIRGMSEEQLFGLAHNPEMFNRWINEMNK